MIRHCALILVSLFLIGTSAIGDETVTAETKSAAHEASSATTHADVRTTPHPPKPAASDVATTSSATAPAAAPAAATPATATVPVTTTTTPVVTIATPPRNPPPVIPTAPPAAPPVWLLPLLIACTACSFAALIVSVVPLVRRQSSAERARAFETLQKAKEMTTSLSDLVDRIGDRLKETTRELSDERFEHAKAIQAEQLAPLTAALSALKEESAKTSIAIESATALLARRPADAVALERQVLGEHWNQFRANKELSGMFDAALQDQSWDPLLNTLEKLVPDDLKPHFDTAVKACREHRWFVSKLNLVPRVVNGEIERRPSDADDIRRTRELVDLVNRAQRGADPSNLLSFRIKSWVVDSFLPFADLYLQHHQQAQLEKREAVPQEGVKLVREVLRIAAVEPIDIAPGETSFDSTRHIGRSTTNDPRFADGVITGVIRNGFVETGRQVIRQPEVIVNRTR